MKKILFTLSFLFFISTYAQLGSCGTTGFIKHNANFLRPSTTIPQNHDTTTPFVLNAFFTLIQDDNGQTIFNNYPINELADDILIENKFLDCIKKLNIRYNQYNIYFKYLGFRKKRNSELTNNGFSGTSLEFSEIQEYDEPNAMNFYFINSSSSSSSSSIIGGTASVYPINLLASYNSSYLDYSLTHEVAHNLSLYHTYEVGSHFPDIPGNEQIIAATLCEHVNRVPSDNILIYNADIAGDEVADTAAQPFLFSFNFLQNCGDYIFNPNNQNCFQEPYELVEHGNFMSSSVNITSNCWIFTPGQITRMRNYIGTNTTNYGYLLGTESVRTDVAALYEPFSAQALSGAVINSVDQPENGGALVCRSQIYRLRFQPGYEQIFSNIPNGSITQTAQQQFNYDNAFDQPIGVTIPSINNNIVNVGVINSITSLNCVFEPYTSGTVYSTAVLGSMNITVKELNQIEAQDPELYSNLMEQYYYILKMMTVSGVKTEQVFYKY